jgi:hypothetical protein
VYSLSAGNTDPNKEPTMRRSTITSVNTFLNTNFVHGFLGRGVVTLWGSKEDVDTAAAWLIENGETFSISRDSHLKPSEEFQIRFDVTSVRRVAVQLRPGA